MIMKRFGGHTLAGACVALLLVLTACSSPSATSGQTTGSQSSFHFYVSVDLSGSGKAYGNAQLLGVQVAAKQLNATGGILGHQIVVDQVNNAGDPTQAVSQLQQYLSQGTLPNAVWPGTSSTVAAAMLPSLTSKKIISFDSASATNLNDPSKYPYHFGDNQPTAQTVATFAQIVQSKGWKNVAMIYGNDVSGQASERAYASALKAINVNLVSKSYDDSALDMSPQLESLRTANPDALLVSGFGTAAIYVVKSRAHIAWTIPTYADFLASFQQYTANLPAASLTGFQVETQRAFLAGDPLANTPVLTQMVTDAKSLGGSSVLSGSGASVVAGGYNAVVLINQAAKQANSIDAAAIKSALEDLKAPTPPVPWLWYGPKDDLGNFAYSASNHYGTAQPEAFTYVPPGQYNTDGLYAPSGQ